MTSNKMLLLMLAAAMPLTIAAEPPQASAAAPERPIVVAQADKPLTPAEKAALEKKKLEQKQDRRPKANTPPQAAPAAQPRPHPPAARAKPPERNADDRRNRGPRNNAPAVAPAVQKPAAPVVAPTVQKPAAAAPATPPERNADDRRNRGLRHNAPAVAPAVQKPAAPAVAPTAQKPAAAAPATPPERDANDRRNRGPRRNAPAAAPAAQSPAAPAVAPTAQKPAATTPAKPPERDANDRRNRGPRRNAPAAAPAAQSPAALIPAPAIVAAPPKVRDANEFLRRNNRRAGPDIKAARKDRRETRDGNRVIIREGDRTIVRENNRAFIHHNESSRFAIGARNIRTQRRGNETVTIVERPGGVRIISYLDRDGRLIRRVRRDRRDREVTLIDNRFAGPRRSRRFVDLGPPVIRIPRERYIVEAESASPLQLFDLFSAPPVERIERRYTLDEVRYSHPLRERMPRVDLAVTFDTGSWELTPDQIDRLAAVAEGLNRTIARNPLEIFMIEGHTDAVGDPEDNLSLSDRRAESVAVALTEVFQVPAENLVTQGYGEEYLKVPTSGPARENRRVAIRRITPLIDRVAGR